MWIVLEQVVVRRLIKNTVVERKKERKKERKMKTALTIFFTSSGFRTLSIVGFLMSLLPPPAQAQKKQLTDEDRAFMEVVNRPIVYAVPGMENVRVMRDIRYTKTDNPNLKMDVFVPPRLSSTSRRPAIILIAGGSGKDGEYEPKNWGIYQSYGKMLAASGLVTISFTHRLGFPELALAEGAEDLQALVNHLRENAARYHIDNENLALVTFSGGGPLLSFGLMGRTPYIRCLVAVYSILDVRENEFALKSVEKEVRERFSPANYVKEGAVLPPLLIVRAGKDGIPNLNKILDAFLQKAIATNITIDVMNHPEGVHGFDNKEPHPRSKEIIKRIAEYLKEHLNEENHAPRSLLTPE